MGHGINRDAPEGRMSVQLHTRKLDRLVAHNNMRKAGYTQINKKIAGRSKFARLWKQFV